MCSVLGSVLKLDICHAFNSWGRIQFLWLKIPSWLVVSADHFHLLYYNFKMLYFKTHLELSLVSGSDPAIHALAKCLRPAEWGFYILIFWILLQLSKIFFPQHLSAQGKTKGSRENHNMDVYIEN